MTLHKTYRALVILGACALFAGCSGSSQMPAAAGLPSVSNSMATPADHGRNHQGCPNDGGIHVMPCRVTFDTNNPGPADVVVTRDGDGGGNHHAIKESDDCASRGIATVTKDTDRLYTATAGSTAGSCTATFNDNGNRNDDGNGRNGGSTLRIVNKL
ncbi:MAG TPA: hypothetical protein VN909_08445 [Candidatus Dormibacteraeota bacterium]|nr:hypothetical protein [Candidatus Dormibacteraeota bacterium]